MQNKILILTAFLPFIHAHPQFPSTTLPAPATATAAPCDVGIASSCPEDHSCKVASNCKEYNDCAGFCVKDPTPEDGRPCGFKIAPCPTGQYCSQTDPTCTRGNNCAGVCVAPSTTTYTPLPNPTPKPFPSPALKSYQSCGGFTAEPRPCPAAHVCMDDPRKGGCGMACDMPGICVPEKQSSCGGFIGKACPSGSGLRCWDDPRDDCDPKRGGADCMGICL